MEKGSRNRMKALPGYRRAIPTLYILALIAMAALVWLNILLKDPVAPDQFGLNAFSAMDTGWFTAGGEAFEIAEIDTLRAQDSDTVSIYHYLPSVIPKDESIVFRSKNSSVSVLIGGEQIYQSGVAWAPFYNHSPGTRWNMVVVRQGDAGKTVEVQVKQAYRDGRAKVDNFYYGDRAAITLKLIHSKLWGCVISLLIFFVALVFICAWIVLNWRRTPKNNSLLWLACFAMIASSWSLLETNLFQFFVRDLQLIQVVDNLMLVLGGLPLFLYMDSIYGVFKSRIVRILCGLNITYILLATLSQFIGLWDYHQTLNGAVTTYGIVVVVLIACLLKPRESVRTKHTKGDRLLNSFQHIGVLLLGLGLLGDLVRYLLMDVLDRALFIRIGLLFFILCFGAGNIYQMILLVKKGLEAEIISLLAYSDGLTKTGNRTAYLERMNHLAAEHAGDGMGIVMFDVNNLKQVNDTLGHKSGDGLLRFCADILEEAFCAPWSVYRIGGDEFVALIHGGDVRAAYEAAAERFAAAVARVNEELGREYPVVIAHGAAFCAVINPQTMEAAEKEADRRMYKDKYRLKCEVPPAAAL